MRWRLQPRAPSLPRRVSSNLPPPRTQPAPPHARSCPPRPPPRAAQAFLKGVAARNNLSPSEYCTTLVPALEWLMQCAAEQDGREESLGQMVRAVGLQPGHMGLQAGHMRLQAGHMGLQAGHMRLQAGHMRLQPGHMRLQAGHMRLQAGHMGCGQPACHGQVRAYRTNCKTTLVLNAVLGAFDPALISKNALAMCTAGSNLLEYTDPYPNPKPNPKPKPNPNPSPSPNPNPNHLLEHVHVHMQPLAGGCSPGHMRLQPLTHAVAGAISFARRMTPPSPGTRCT